MVQQVESGQRYRGEKPEGFSGLRLGELLIYGGLLSVSSVLYAFRLHIQLFDEKKYASENCNQGVETLIRVSKP